MDPAADAVKLTCARDVSREGSEGRTDVWRVSLFAMKTVSFLCASATTLSLLLCLPAGAAAEDAKKDPAAGASAESPELTKSMYNAKKICEACIQWASKNEGKFPDRLEDLFTPEYLGAKGGDYLKCPLLHNDQVPGYIYIGRGFRTNGRPQTVVLVSQWQDAEHNRIAGHGDGTVTVEFVKAPGGWRSKGEAITGGTIQNPDIPRVPPKP